MEKFDKALISAAPASERAGRVLYDASFRATLVPPLEGPPPSVGGAARAIAPAERALRIVPAPQSRPRPPASDVPSLIGRVQEIVDLDHQPVLRNLMITQCYHDLSDGLADLLGVSNANWCTFATWASKTAGRFIRKDEVPAKLRRLLGADDDETEGPVRASGIRLRTPFLSEGLGLFDVPERALDEVSSMIAQGNLKVFSELGPVFARMIELYKGRGRPTQAQLDALLEPIRTGPSTDGGQGLLRNALTHYHQAMLTDDPDAKAELILLGNARVGLHEQVRLQPYIVGSLNAPVRVVIETFSSPAARLPEVLQSARLEGLLRPAVERLQSLWREVATKEMMTLQLPDETLDLGQDLPAEPGQPLYPQYLRTIEDPELYELLREYGAHDSTTLGSGARDWAYLPARMGYILELFRSRQRSPHLMGQPFERDDHLAIVANRIPPSGNL